MHAFVTLLNKLAFSRKYLLQPYIDSLSPEKAIQSSEPDEMKHLIMFYSQGRIEPAMYYKKIAELRRGTSSESARTAECSIAAAAKELHAFLSDRNEKTFNEKTFTRFVESVRIDSRSLATFRLTCGLELSERIG